MLGNIKFNLCVSLLLFGTAHLLRSLYPDSSPTAKRVSSKKCENLILPKLGHSYYWNLLNIKRMLTSITHEYISVAEMRFICQCTDCAVTVVVDEEPDETCGTRQVSVLCPPRLAKPAVERKCPSEDQEDIPANFSFFYEIYGAKEFKMAEEYFAVRDKVSDYFDEMVGPAADISWCDLHDENTEWSTMS